MTKRSKRRLRILAIVLILLSALTFAAFYRGLTVARYKAASSKLQNREPIWAVLLTDLHCYIYGPGQEPLIRQVKELRPDVIFLSGDMADDRNPFSGMELLLEGIANLAPCYYVTGSHDYWSMRAVCMM
jgi:predicted MPP superfamily phosphohydrolase